MPFIIGEVHIEQKKHIFFNLRSGKEKERERQR